MDSKITFASALASRMSDKDNRWLISGLESSGGIVRKGDAAVSFLLDSLDVE